MGGSSFSETLADALQSLSQALGQLADALEQENTSGPGISHLLTQLIPQALTNQNGPEGLSC